ncbi:hypothetical protein [Bradyrhizobium sp. Leo121]|uniref:ATP-dependent DNA ligase n=1 Tax=Bradyrhizobium sp. Leo121 TaxID=1571195 RepID=UPI001FE01B64|nr:hypothetical protein [Bradyrhizobium sp. Leo121]
MSRLPTPASSSRHYDVERVPTGARWIHEIKFDGYRVQAHIANEAVEIFTRRGIDWTRAAFARSPMTPGTTEFSVLENEFNGRSRKIVLVAFNLLCLDGHDLRKLPLSTRKAALKKLVAGTDVQFSESFAMFEHACQAEV